MLRLAFVLSMLFILRLPVDAEADWFVFTSADTDQVSAQGKAADKGGWVLDTDFYPDLTPGLYAVVRGPFATKSLAESQLKELLPWRKDAYIKDAGDPIALPPIGSPTLDSRLLAALLGELSVEVTRHKGARHGCEPQQPYRAVRLYWTTIIPVLEPDGGIGHAPSREEIPLGGFWIIESTGEVDRMRRCLE